MDNSDIEKSYGLELCDETRKVFKKSPVDYILISIFPAILGLAGVLIGQWLANIRHSENIQKLTEVSVNLQKASERMQKLNNRLTSENKDLKEKYHKMSIENNQLRLKIKDHEERIFKLAIIEKTIMNDPELRSIPKIAKILKEK